MRQQRVLKVILRRVLRTTFRGAITLDAPEALQRRWIEAVSLVTLTARGTRTEPADGPVPATWVRPATGRDDRAMLYLHGGGYTVGSASTHKAITSHLARAAGATILVPAYRLAPEHPYPAALDDAMLSYKHLLERWDASQIVIAGDSAGGGLALLLAIALREARMPPPAGLILLSPWTDLTLSGETITTLADVDPLLGRPWLERAAIAFCGELSPDDPRVSPLYADLRGLPRLLVQAAGEEILLSDAERLVDRARAAGVEVTFQREDGLWHDFHLHAGLLDASDAAIARLAAFAETVWTTPAAAPKRTRRSHA